MDVAIRRAAGTTDARAAADLWPRARAAAGDAIPPPAHSDDEVREWFSGHVLAQLDLVLAERSGDELAALLVLGDGWVEQLYVEPGLTGQGIGSALITFAKREQPAGLRLWTFASNAGAQRFHERHGFVAERRTDGRDNEERAPDILYAWRGTAA